MLQLVFTYAPPLQALFDTRPLDPLADELPILGSGALLLAVLELEKLVHRRLTASHGRRD